MDSDTVLDFAQFQLSPRKSRCELFISGGGKTEKIASGLLKPFLTHLKVVEEQVNQSGPLINLEAEKRKNEDNWFNKGTLERFVRYVSTPEVLESVNTFDAEVLQLEGARKIYSQGSESQLSTALGETDSASAADLTKKELLRAIDLRLAAVKQDLAKAFARASSAGFSLNTVSELLLFADRFGAHRLRGVCTMFISLCQNRPDLITNQSWKGIENNKLRSSSDSNMSIDEPETDPTPLKPSTCSDTISGKDKSNPTEDVPTQLITTGSRRLSVQDRINLFEGKQKEQTTSAAISSNTSIGGGASKDVHVKGEHRRQASDGSVEKSVFRRWSNTSDMSIDVTSSSSSFFSAVATPTSSESFKDTYTSLSKLGSKDSPQLPCLSSSLSFSHDQNLFAKEKIHDSDFNNGTESETEDSANVTDYKTPVAPTLEKNHAPSSDTKLEASVTKIEDEITKSKVTIYSHLQSQSSLDKVENTSKQCKLQVQSNAHAGNQEAVKNEEVTASHKPIIVSTESGPNSQRMQPNQPHVSVLPAQKAQVTNNELQMKADELEKLFAAHMLRVHADQASSSRKNKTMDSQTPNYTQKKQHEATISDQLSVEKKESGLEAENDLLRKLAYNLDSTNNMKKLGGFSPSDEFRGKHYATYMQKRDEKLKEERGSKRAEKEAKLKAMQDSLEHSLTEMKAKLANSVNKRDSEFARRHAEKMRSFNVRSPIKAKGETTGLFNREGEEDVAGKSYSDTLSDNESSTSSKRLSYSKSLSSSTARAHIPSIPKPSFKPLNSNSTRRRSHVSENPLAQSVPNFSDLRKENTKPASGLTKISQPRKLVQSKSFTDETTLVRAEKSRRHSTRKNSASDSSKDHLEQSVKDIERNSEPKPFLRKSNGSGPGARSGKIIPKPCTNRGILKEEVDSEGLTEYQENLLSKINEHEEVFSRTSVEFDVEPSVFPVEPSQENIQESPGESPWNLSSRNSLSYANETSDIDASVGSPVGSPTSWSSHPLNQMMEADAAHMRKKWGSAQIPVLVANAPHNTRKDVTKGFKRLLNFGRKSRGSDYLVNDWVSASTASECDEEIDDCKEFGSRNFDELRKSRMGYTVSSYDCFNDTDTFPEQARSIRSSIPSAPANFKFREDHLSGSSLKAPRSFFSLSSFRSKANDAKPR